MVTAGARAEDDLLPQAGILKVEEDENPISAVNQGRCCTDCDC